MPVSPTRTKSPPSTLARSDKRRPSRAVKSHVSTTRFRDSSDDRRPTRRKSESVAALLGAQIIDGRLRPGDLLPTEVELCTLLSLSRASVREGLRALSAKGLLETRTRRGTIVCAKTRWDILDPDLLEWMSQAPPDPELLMMLLETRRIVEPATARLAAQRATAAQIVEIRATCKAMTDALPDDVEACCRHDLDLHQLIIAAAGNVFLSRFAVAIRAALLSSFRVSANARVSFENSLAEHWAVTDAITSRDADGAERAMRDLLAGTGRDLAPALPSTPKPGTVRARPRKT